MHTNENITIGIFKEAMLKILLEPEEKNPLQKTERTTGGRWSSMYCHSYNVSKDVFICSPINQKLF